MQPTSLRAGAQPRVLSPALLLPRTTLQNLPSRQLLSRHRLRTSTFSRWSLCVAASAAAEGPPQEQQPAPPAAWLEQCHAVAACAAQHHRLPQAARTKAQPLAEGERGLGLWCADQQRRKDGSKGPPLSRAERAALEAVPHWAWAKKQCERVPWEQRHQQLAAFVLQQGRLPRKADSKLSPLLPGERQLRVWCDKQRQRWKGQRQPPLTAAQQGALEDIPGWFWEQWTEVPWEQRLQQVAAFVQQQGSLPRLSGSHELPLSAGERGLWAWCMHQRQRRKGHAQPPLSAEQQAALEAIPGWVWEQFKQVPWEQRLQQVVAFTAQHGRLPRVEGSKQGALLPGEGQLGTWCDYQRQRQKRNSKALTAEERGALEGIVGWFWDEAELWERQRQAVAAFVQQHGRLPRRGGSQEAFLLPGERQLGTWCVRQQQRRKGNVQPPLTAEQQAALEGISGWVWEQFEQVPWEQRLQQAVAFTAQQGRLPRVKGSKQAALLPGERQLGAWCIRQQQRRKGNVQPPLTAEQQAALEGIDGWRW